jgi:hypothetical protein
MQDTKLFICNEAVLGFTSRSNSQDVFMITETLSQAQAKKALDGLHAPQLRPISLADYEKAFRFIVAGKVGDCVEFGYVHCWIRIR